MKLKRIISVGAQRAILQTSYFLHLMLLPKRKRNISENSWVVGVEEIASMLWRTHSVIPNSTSVLLHPHSWYKFAYTWERKVLANSRLDVLYRQIYGPWLLGKLATTSKGFIYLGSQGFLDEQIDHREYEFNFLKQHKKFIVCIFTGDDIRSHFETKALAKKFGFPNLATVRELSKSFLTTVEYDNIKRKIASVADQFADEVLSWPVEQAGYLTKESKKFTYAYPLEMFNFDLEKFDRANPIVVVHAPSKMDIKGTPYVHDAIIKLENDGFVFKYIELHGVTNNQVVETIRKAHIVLAQFHQYTPCVFGIESMANSCVLLCSGDESIETTLSKGANEAWVVTKPDEIYSHLRYLLENPQELKGQAMRGYEWTLEYESSEAAVRYFDKLLSAISNSKKEQVTRKLN